MEFKNDYLRKMKINKDTLNNQYSRWYYGLSELAKFGEYNGNSQTLKNKSENINNCLNLWVWDKYEKNKILDLKSVNRCKNNRFCPNCRILDVSKFIHKFKDILPDYLNKGYSMYMLTLTIPNVTADDLEFTLVKMSKCFKNLTKRYSCKSKKHHSVDFSGGVRVLEITYNPTNNTYHPHYHCLILINGTVDDFLTNKHIKGRFSKKRNSYNLKSLLDLEISRYWTMIYNGISITKNSIISDDDAYECDFVELDQKGFYEIFKYTFKDTDVHDFDTFKTLESALSYKRLRQGFGCLYNVKCEDIDDGELQDLSLTFGEEPEMLLTREIEELYTVYKDYKKISRFNADIDENILNQ